ncbi:uncharacterized protein LOC104899024 [Beta vulgaris subsp. vulgaris]|uniref:uncharacterized protein LOC104899024 n=1 Tax=Beta vulgaris subsp. vulgaris TaxID=3555 RepID=UPI00053FD992|nr:uncharacterized protein LOC104899024 [Beta vulgaris subsp. vulgaris]
MDNILTWNVRELNSKVKQQDVRKFLSSHNVKLFSLLETRVKSHNMGRVYMNLCPGWCFTHTNSCHGNGRIMVGWWPHDFRINIIEMTSQYIHCAVKPTQGNAEFWCTFVYGFNDCNSRTELWTGLRNIASKCNLPWVVLGDSNALSRIEDRIGSLVRMAEIKPMLDCLIECGLVDMKSSGRHYTWSNKQDGAALVMSTIDRAVVNKHWQEIFENAEAVFLLEGDFDHTPILLSVYPEPPQKKKFRFCNAWCEYPVVMEAMRREWSKLVVGCPMYRVIEKLKKVREALRQLKKQGVCVVDMEEVKAREKLAIAQNAMHNMPSNDEAIRRERVFYQANKARRVNNRIHAIHNSAGEWLNTPEGVQEAFLSFNQNLFAEKPQQQKLLDSLVNRGKKLTEIHLRILNAPVTRADIKRVIFSIPDGKAP